MNPVERHPLWLRCLHWLGFSVLFLMILTGFKAAQLIKLKDQTGWVGGVHFSVAWLYTLIGVLYLHLSVVSGRWQEIVPDREAFRTLLPTIRGELGLGEKVRHTGKFNAAQRFAYTGFALLAIVEGFTGIAIYKPVQLRTFTLLVGGYDAAHLIHRIGMFAMIAFFLVHVIQVIRSGWKGFHPMIGQRARVVNAVGVGFGVVAFTVMLRLPVFYRHVGGWSDSLWQKLYDPRRLNLDEPPPAGKEPRLNGTLGMKSAIILSDWQLAVRSDRDPNGQPAIFNIEAIRAMPRTDTSTLFMCIEGWSDPWSYAGVKFSDFLKFTGLGTRSGKPWNPEDPNGMADLYSYVGLATPDKGYYVSIDMQSMLHPQTVLAYEMNGRPLELIHGAPLRLAIPIKYGVKNIKRIGSIVFSDQRPPDFQVDHGESWYMGL